MHGKASWALAGNKNIEQIFFLQNKYQLLLFLYQTGGLFNSKHINSVQPLKNRTENNLSQDY